MSIENSKRIAKELSESKIACIVNDKNSIEFYPREDMKYVFSDLSKYPFVIPAVRIVNPEINGKNWLTNSFKMPNIHGETISYPEFVIESKGEVSLKGLQWSPEIRLIEIMNIIEHALQNKRNI